MDEGGGGRRHEGAREAWAKIDRELVEEAVAVPYDWGKQPNIESKDVARRRPALEHRGPGTTPSRR